MNWRDRFPGVNGQELRRVAVVLACPAIIVWLGGDAIGHISELYDGLCEVQGPGMATLLYDGNRLGNCTGIGSYLSTLGLIMGVAALAVPAALAGYWYYADQSAG